MSLKKKLGGIYTIVKQQLEYKNTESTNFGKKLVIIAQEKTSRTLTSVTDGNPLIT